ncbi:hypothetical protein [Paraliomyxa miuraensis]|uniref:hypothetical protein n=1 Tax=Paraliomyxa miuraensis TaxID=376150 RepID=UPI0022570830|nr:hypothetical protein [Paraliomyxa miuraensis]MCX4247621.1 hypothetical protein [Paraliomyxa miuraensis]
MSVALHAALLAWGLGQASPTTTQRPPAPIPVEFIEITPPTPQPLALRADGGQERATPSPTPPRGEGAEPLPRPDPTPAPHEPRAAKPEPPREPAATPSPASSLEAEPADEDEPANEETPSTSADEEPDEDPAGARPSGTPAGTGSLGRGRGGTGSHGTPDHSAYGAELVRLIMTEIDEDPVPGLSPKDSIEVELEVLPSGRLARRGLGKYDYARVVRTTLGPMRLRAILRRILRASQDFPPHPSSFPRQRYVVGITVEFRGLHG